MYYPFRLTLIVLFFLLSGAGNKAFCQWKLWEDYKDHVGKPFQEKPKILFGFDTRQSFISKKQVKIFGVKAGLNFDDRFRVGICYHFLQSRYLYRVNDSTVSKLRFGYMSGFAEYVFWRNPKWEVGMPLYLGLGLSGIKDDKENTRRWIMPMEFSFYFQYKPFCWIGLGAGVGYRHLLVPNKAIDVNFNSAIYLFKIRLYFTEVYNCLRKDKSKCKGLWKWYF